MSTVRVGTSRDIETLTALAQLFHAESPYRYASFDESAVHEFLLDCIAESSRELFVIESGAEIVGGACVARTRMYFSRSSYYATELGWFVAPTRRNARHGLKLLQAMERWAKQNRCEFLSITRFGGRPPRGYELLEANYARRLSP